MTNTLNPVLAKAVLADVERDAARRGPVLSALRSARRRRAARRSVQVVPAPVRIVRPAGW